MADNVDTVDATAVDTPPGPFREFVSSFRENRGAVFGLVVLTLVVLTAIFAQHLAPHSPTEQFRAFTKIPPVWEEGGNWGFILGTDAVGRDTLSRLIYGARVSLFIGLSVMFISMVVGIVLGLVAAFSGGMIDTVISRMMDLIMSMPSLVLCILIVSVTQKGLASTIIAVTIVYLPGYVRLVRGSALSELSKDYVMAARTIGVGRIRLMTKTVLPNCMAPLIVQAALGVSNAILEAAALGFLGLGAQPPISEWGTMLADNREFLRSDPWLLALPGLAILITVVGINLMGDGLRDALDPKMKRG